MIVIKNGRLIDPKSGRDEITDILIDEGIVKKIGKNINVKGNIIQAKGCIVAPGLIDIHSHFRDPGFTYKEDIFSGALSAAEGGYTTIVCMANTKPVVDNCTTLGYILNKARNCKIEILQTCAITKGLDGSELTDMKMLKHNGAVGFSDDGRPILNPEVALKAMIMSREFDVPLSFHEEDNRLIDNNGINCSKIADKLGLIGSPSYAEEIMVARDCILAEKTGAKIDLQHISSGLSVDIIRYAKMRGVNIYAEVTPHHFSLNEEDVLRYGTNAKMNPPLRSEEDRKKIIEGIKDGTLNIIATDHAPHSIEEKSLQFDKAPSGIIGLETALCVGITYLVSKGHLTLMELLQRMTVNPAALYNLDRGYIKENHRADIVIFNPDEEWTVSSFKSKSSNSPYLGMRLKGRIKNTICNGVIVK